MEHDPAEAGKVGVENVADRIDLGKDGTELDVRVAKQCKVVQKSQSFLLRYTNKSPPDLEFESYDRLHRVVDESPEELHRDPLLLRVVSAHQEGRKDQSLDGAEERGTVPGSTYIRESVLHNIQSFSPFLPEHVRFAHLCHDRIPFGLLILVLRGRRLEPCARHEHPVIDVPGRFGHLKGHQEVVRLTRHKDLCDDGGG